MNTPASPPITPPPIHRSKTLWLGILVLTFLAWAWRDSTHWQTSLYFRQYIITHAGSGICLLDRRFSHPDARWERSSILPKDETWSRPHIDSPEIFSSTGDPEQIALYYQTAGLHTANPKPRNAAAHHLRPLFQLVLGPYTTRFVPGSWALFLPHWLLILTFLTIWLALLLWRSRRLHRLTKPIG